MTEAQRALHFQNNRTSFRAIFKFIEISHKFYWLTNEVLIWFKNKIETIECHPWSLIKMTIELSCFEKSYSVNGNGCRWWLSRKHYKHFHKKTTLNIIHWNFLVSVYKYYWKSDRFCNLHNVHRPPTRISDYILTSLVLGRLINNNDIVLSKHPARVLSHLLNHTIKAFI